jgi:hypothetical protein
MRGRRALKGGAPRLLGHHGGTDGKAYRRAFDALGSEFILDSALLCFEAGRVAMLRVEFEAASVALMEARRKRRVGKGRRPNPRLVEQLARRAGLADGSYSQALDKLRGLVAERERARKMPTPAELLHAVQTTGRTERARG